MSNIMIDYMITQTTRYFSRVKARLDSIMEKLGLDLPCLEDYGGKGDYSTENSLALQRLLASGAKGMRLNRGIYRFNDNVSFPTSFVIRGVGAPTLGFGTVDSKQYLRKGYKHLMPGSSMIFSGSASKAYIAPQRDDEFNVMRPCVRLANVDQGSQGTQWSGFAIIQDMECRTEDGTAFTKPGQENMSDYDTGFLLDDCARTDCRDVVVFGYFSKAGTVVSSKLGNDDPDYNTWWGGSTMGKQGFALLGSNKGPATHGLSGTRLFGTGIYNLDHHSRGSLTPAELTEYYKNANEWSCIFIDGDVDASSAEINGHEFHACEIRSRSNHGLRLGHASNVKFYGGVYEFVPYGIPNSDEPTFIGSANVKRGIEFNGLRNNHKSTILNDNFAGVIPVPIVVIGDPFDGRIATIHRDPAGGWSMAILGSDGNVGDSGLQLTKDANNGNADWRLTWDISAGKPVQLRHNGTPRLSLTSAGAMTLSAPTGSDSAILLSNDTGSNRWAMRTQMSSYNQFQFRTDGTSGNVATQLFSDGTITAGTTGIGNLGLPDIRYANTYLANSPNVSSDARLKEQISDIPESWLKAALNVKWVRYKMKQSVATKQDNARYHIGVIAQQVIEAFAEQNVNAFEIGIVGLDKWDDRYDDVMIEVLNDKGEPTGELRPTGDRVLIAEAGEALNVRYEELLSLMWAAKQYKWSAP